MAPEVRKKKRNLQKLIKLREGIYKSYIEIKLNL